MFGDALRAIFLLSIAFVVILQLLARHVGEEAMEGYAAAISWPWE